ncbi:hypothetical protein [Actinomadura geliboluensis]|uniref:Uncharacterized protein n=1 Tax=Actinomadura geliboluensis TaxID=882440 RepID=A0A5S4FXH3_9ACTN|nr:hypothetical protein [Actinomadura geliboluensis]TMR25379.1 hypothetical protein ETD96_42650 [Actinomadura geliboluensis]
MDGQGSLTTETRAQRSAAGALAAALRERGLAATVRRHWVVGAFNPAGEPGSADHDDGHGAGAGDEGGQAFGPGLRQEVRCTERPEGALWWFWVWWDGPAGSGPDLEPLCPADEIETAAQRTAAVLTVSPG